ncbi:MAG: DUF3822 family protein [Saprospiraceae bacterium]|jgi:hypothetical protein|nr:DUF3822 family protein [Saprospiraceae bacterium]MBP9209671.1 DUF3822 family protein [Saprospiraceae bacterium]MBV6471968.1 hypothetical protein [Saprospiraceae bacterium]
MDSRDYWSFTYSKKGLRNVSYTRDYIFLPSDGIIEEGHLIHKAPGSNWLIHSIPGSDQKLAFLVRGVSAGSDRIFEDLSHVFEWLPEVRANYGNPVEAQVCGIVDGMRLACFSHRADDLLFTSIHSFERPEDVLYHLLQAYAHSGLNPETDPLYISGEIFPESLLVQFLRRYFPGPRVQPFNFSS